MPPAEDPAVDAFRRAFLARALELDIGRPQPYVMESMFLMYDQEFDEARDRFERGIRLTDEESAERQVLLIRRAEICLQCGRFAESLDAAERALVIYDKSVTVLLLKAKAQLGLDQAAARETLQRILELQPDHAEAKQLLGG